VALSSIGAEGIRFMGDSGGGIGAMEVTAQACGKRSG